MRIFPLALITIGVFALLKHFGFIDAAFMQLFWPLLLIAVGLLMLLRGPRWRARMRGRMQERWEQRLNHRFGPGWANLNEDERERFRAGMRQWRGGPCGGGRDARADGEGSAKQPPAAV